MLDAMLNMDIARNYFPRIEAGLHLSVDAPHERVMQAVGLPVGKSSLRQLEPGKRGPEEEERVAKKRDRLVKVVRKMSAGLHCLVITHKELEQLFKGIEPNIEGAHFNAIEGIDRWRNVDCLSVICTTRSANSLRILSLKPAR